MADPVAEALHDVLTSPNVADANGEIANLVDTTNYIANGLHRIADQMERANDIAERQEAGA